MIIKYLLNGFLPSVGMRTLSYFNPVDCSQLDPEQAEALRQRLGRARKVKLYLLQQSGSNSFLVAGDEKNQKNQKYKVNIGPQVVPRLKSLYTDKNISADLLMQQGPRLPAHPLHNAACLCHS